MKLAIYFYEEFPDYQYIMTEKQLKTLKIQIEILNILNIGFLIANILLIVIPIVHYWSAGFKFDKYFLTITLLNAFALYVSLEIANRLSFYRKKHAHFTNKLQNRN